MINEHFEPNFNAVWPSAIVFQQLLNENTSDAERSQRAKKGAAGYPQNHLMAFVRYLLNQHAGEQNLADWPKCKQDVQFVLGEALKLHWKLKKGSHRFQAKANPDLIGNGLSTDSGFIRVATSIKLVIPLISKGHIHCQAQRIKSLELLLTA